MPSTPSDRERESYRRLGRALGVAFVVAALLFTVLSFAALLLLVVALAQAVLS